MQSHIDFKIDLRSVLPNQNLCVRATGHGNCLSGAVACLDGVNCRTVRMINFS